MNPKNNLVDDTTVSFISMNMIDEQFSGKYQYEIKNWSVCKNGFTHFASNDVAFAKISPCFENRKSVLFEKLENDVGAGTTELYVIRRYINNILGKYILYFVKSEYFILRGKNTFSGVVGQQRVDKDVMLDTYFPIPPLNEQKKIVKKVELLMELLNSMETSLS